MATLRQINANKINSLSSCGPKSPEGKSISRANALKHGLAGEGVVLPDEERATVDERVQQWNSSLRPFTEVDLWLVELVATEAVRIERCRILETSLREEEVRRAGESWDQDRELAAARLATRLSTRPEVVALELATTTQGVDLLIERWRALGAALELRKTWNEAERSLALDLLGVPRVLRELPTPLDAASQRPASLAGLVAERIEKLQTLKPTLDQRDGREQGAAMLGHAPPSADLNRLRRYENACLRKLQWAYARLKSGANPSRTQSPHNPILPQPTPDARPLLVAGRIADSFDNPFTDTDNDTNPFDEPAFQNAVNINIPEGSPTFPQFRTQPEREAPSVLAGCPSL